MFDGRIYRAAFVPLLFVIAIVGFSLASRPSALSSNLAPDAFNGTRAFTDLHSLSQRFPDRQPGGVGDNELAGYIARRLGELGGTAGGGFQISTRHVQGRTVEGVRTLTTVIAERPGSTGESPIAIFAHRDAVRRGSAAELSGTAALLELARVFSQSETRRTIVLVFTSGGSGGYAGARDFALHGSHPLDAAIVLGDLAGTLARTPFVLPFSSDSEMAPEGLQLTLDRAISQEVGAKPGTPSASAQLAHMVFPLATGEEAPLNAAGVPSVLVQVSGERGPSPGELVSEPRLQNFGSAILSATYALDEGPNVAGPAGPRLLLGRKVFPSWALRLLVLALLVPPLLMCVDALARLRRRREPVLRWVVWTLNCALPIFVCALFAMALGMLGIVAAPTGQPSWAALSADGSLVSGAVACGALFVVLLLLGWPMLLSRLSLPLRPTAEGSGLAMMLVLLTVALLTWIFNPFACALLVPALHLWPLVVSSDREAGPTRRLLASTAIVAGLMPLVLLLVVYSRELGLGPGGLVESAMLVLAGGQVGLFGALLWSAALGCVFAVVLIFPGGRSVDAVPVEDWHEISTRGPVSYAGPGSLGGTESALRR